MKISNTTWDKIKGRVKIKYPQVTDEDLIYQDGDFDLVIDCLHKKTGRPRKEIINDIRKYRFMLRFGSWFGIFKPFRVSDP